MFHTLCHFKGVRKFTLTRPFFILTIIHHSFWWSSKQNWISWSSTAWRGKHLDEGTALVFLNPENTHVNEAWRWTGAGLCSALSWKLKARGALERFPLLIRCEGFLWVVSTRRGNVDLLDASRRIKSHKLLCLLKVLKTKPLHGNTLKNISDTYCSCDKTDD